MRQRLANQFDTSTTRPVVGKAQGGGARFAMDIAGSRQQAVNLDAELEAISRPGGRQSVGDTLDVFRATGTRKPQGSPTDFNRQIRDTVGEVPILAQAIAAAKTGGASFVTSAGDATRRAWLGRNTATLADLLTAPDSVDRIGFIVRQGLATPVADATLRQALQGR
ncbi:hypothetical protein [Methylobacterium trifolii]|uniref:Uncharacterized protein n=1 Tax=Methylobacterium trifolii TaxID=1003092 RepID=A0ABQ4TZD7_9HYPH|nr:hypothetical protein [Methylobacterium trifolii]GJE60279.1 hypothetical protein MPOCJGCO_2390 [Methylobacterium trifolii]